MKTQPEGVGRPFRSKQRVFAALVLLVVAVTFTNLISLLPQVRLVQSLNTFAESEDPADSFQDNIWPIRQQTPWDISTDFSYPRLLQYRVTEGTWLRLDVHPTSGDVVFDMLGEIYCIPGRYVLDSQFAGEQAEARPILQGIPFDSDPHFSPAGDTLVFRSDAGLGLENIWVTEWKSCEAMDLRSTSNPYLEEARSFKVEDEDLLIRGVVETKERQRRRLLREGRADAKRVTNETFRWVTDARFHPSGKSVVATKWYTSSRSIGAGEGWEYSLPSLEGEEQDPIPVESGKRVVSRTPPPGVDYFDQQIGPEQVIWNGEDGLIFSKNVLDASTFQYSKDVHKGIYSIFAKNLTTGTTETLVDSVPGGASRPELSRDRRTLAFVRRVRDKEVLVLKDLETGTVNYAWDGLTYDDTPSSAPMGTYPSFAFTPEDNGIVIWAAGQIHHVPLKENKLGERILAREPRTIPFSALIELRLGELRSYQTSVDLVGLETQDTSRLYAFKDLRVDEEGKRAVFQAAGVTIVQDIGKSNITNVPVLQPTAPYYFPSFVPGTSGNMIVHGRWSETSFTSFELADLHSGKAFEVGGLPLGRYRSPVLSTSQDTKRKFAFVKTGGDWLTGNIIATSNPGLYVGDLDFAALDNGASTVELNNLRLVPSEVGPSSAIQMQFIDEDKLLVSQEQTAFIIDLAGETDKSGQPPHYTLAKGRTSIELRASVKPKQFRFRDWLDCVEEGDILCRNVADDSGFALENVAFVDFLNPYIAPGSSVGGGEDDQGVWSKPGNSTEGLARVGVDGGHSLTWSSDGKKLFWFLGPILHSLEASKLSQCQSEIASDPETFGIACVKGLIEFQEVVFEYSTDIARLKKDAKATSKVVIQNATILTMHTGDLDTDLIRGGSLVVKDGVIQSIGELSHGDLEGAEVIQADGGFVVPGFLDVHSHWSGATNPHPAKSWEMETFLAYGVTTMHNPSTDTVNTFIERGRVESGHFIGPRILHTGSVVYGAADNELHQTAVDRDDAKAILTRIKVEGGPYGISYKNYNQPIRASRQRLLLAAKNLSMLCVPEGGMSLDWGLTYIIDGMSTHEHSIPIPVLHDDILQLFAQSGTADTPTHIVHYGSTFGEEWVWTHEDVPFNDKLRRFIPHDGLYTLAESTSRPKSSYQFFNTSASLAKMVGLGGKTLIGAHGEPPLGLNYHAELFFTQQGGLSNYQTLQAATSWAAQTFGLFGSVGSLAEGKLGDFLVYPQGVDLLKGPIGSTRRLKYVARGGRVWNADTMEEVWPVKGRKQKLPPFNAE